MEFAGIPELPVGRSFNPEPQATALDDSAASSALFGEDGAGILAFGCGLNAVVGGLVSLTVTAAPPPGVGVLAAMESTSLVKDWSIIGAKLAGAMAR